MPRNTPDEILDLQFPSDNKWDIPVLDPKHQPTALDVPCVAWGSIARSTHQLGTYHFYVDDYRFSSVWKKPRQVLGSGVTSVTEVNFSIFNSTPAAEAIGLIYRKRWLARLFQTHGIKIFVDLYVPATFHRMNLFGVPKGWNAYSTRGTEKRVDELGAELDIAQRHSGHQSPLFVVIGGGKKVSGFCNQHHLIHVK